MCEVKSPLSASHGTSRKILRDTKLCTLLFIFVIAEEKKISCVNSNCPVATRKFILFAGAEWKAKQCVSKEEHIKRTQDVITRRHSQEPAYFLLCTSMASLRGWIGWFSGKWKLLNSNEKKSDDCDPVLFSLKQLLRMCREPAEGAAQQWEERPKKRAQTVESRR